jgi:hypothetical protein
VPDSSGRHESSKQHHTQKSTYFHLLILPLAVFEK